MLLHKDVILERKGNMDLRMRSERRADALGYFFQGMRDDVAKGLDCSVDLGGVRGQHRDCSVDPQASLRSLTNLIATDLAQKR